MKEKRDFKIGDLLKDKHTNELCVVVKIVPKENTMTVYNINRSFFCLCHFNIHKSGFKLLKGC